MGDRGGVEVHQTVHITRDVTPPRYVEADLSVPLSQDAIGATMIACDVASFLCVSIRWFVAGLEHFNAMFENDPDEPYL